MKKILFVLAALLIISGCESDDEKRARLIREQAELSIQQDQLARQQQQAGLNVQQPQAEYAQTAPTQQQPQVVYQQPAPTVVQAAPSSNGMTDMLVGGLIGHAIGSSGSQSRYDAPVNRTVINKTYVNKTYSAPPAPAPAAPIVQPAKKNYVDTSKFSAAPKYTPPSVASKPRAMNMSKLSSYGRRK